MFHHAEPVPRNRHTFVVGTVARISGCPSQKELSLEDQIDHAEEVVEEIYAGPVEYRVVATKGKGESLDRPELVEIENMIRSGELDVLIMEDTGRLVRGVDTVRLWGIAVDHGTRCIAPNDGCDTADESWEEDLISSCRDHVGHNSHTSKRLKKKLMNRFKKHGGAVPHPIAGYIKPPDAKTYDDWRKDDSATETIQAGLTMLKETLNCSAVAEWFNNIGFDTGPYCKRKIWNGHMVRLFYQNRLLAGHPGRGFRHTVKHHESGRRISVKNTNGCPIFLDLPHLAHVDASEQDEVNELLDNKNDCYRRKEKNGNDPLLQKPRKRTRFPGQYARCWYCGRRYVWGGNGVTENLMCSGSREWRCWNSIGFRGELAVTRIVDAITKELYELDEFDDQFCEMVNAAKRDGTGLLDDRWRQLSVDESELARKKENLQAAILEYGPRSMFQEQLDALDATTAKILRERCSLGALQTREPELPNSVEELREALKNQFLQLGFESPEFGYLMQQLVPEFHVYLVRLCDGGHLFPRARIKLNLAGSIPDADYVPELKTQLTRVLTLDLFEQPPQRERIRQKTVLLANQGVFQRQIAKQFSENVTQPAVQNALALDRKMKALELDDPFVILTDPPEDYKKLRRHKNSNYRFEPLDGYEPPQL